MGKIIGKVSGNNSSEQIVGNLNNNSTQISSKVGGSNLKQITGNVNESGGIIGTPSGADFGTVNGRVTSVIDAADLQKQIDDLKARDAELFNIAGGIRLDLQAEIEARLEQASSLLFYLNEETAKREAADDSIREELAREINHVLQLVANLQEDWIEALSHKVDIVPGKALSTNDFTDEYKYKVGAAYVKSHEHSNKELLDTYTQPNDDLADAVEKKHSHSNLSVLNDITAAFTTDKDIKLAGIENNAEANIIEGIKLKDATTKKLVPDAHKNITIDISGKVDKISGKGLSTNDFTDALKEKLDNIEPEAEPNTIESISVNGTPQAIIDKNVDIVISNIPTKTSDLINDGEGNGAFTTKNYVDEVADLKQDILEFNPSEVPVTAITLTGIKNGDDIYVIPESGQTIDWSDVANKPHFKEVSVTANYNDLVNTPDIPENTSDLNNDSGFITDSALDGYATEDFVEAYHDDTKQDTLIFNPEIPSGTETTPLATLKDGSTYYILDSSKTDTRTGPVVNFIFENSTEVTYSDQITTDCLLTIPNSISQGFISLLTISNMVANKTFTIQKESESIPFNIRIVSDNTKYPGNTYTTAINGKKIIFARCDGVDVEILIIEELEG